jgi:Leucine-rich repeat (LRR) protein
LKGLLTIFSILYLSILSATSQLSQDELDTCRIYTTLESALANPDDVYILKLPKIKAKEFPTEILQFKNLNVLDLSKNKLSELPDTLASLQQLQEIDLGKNKFEIFPVVLTQLIHLKKLTLSQNMITAIPFDINQLKDLEILDMWSNDLYVIPDSISDLKKLKVFDLRVIQFTETEKEHITQLLPNTKIQFSNSCNCAH